MSKGARDSSIVYRTVTNKDTYSSFCLILHPEDFDLLTDPDCWESSVLFKEFSGFPRRERVLDSFPLASDLPVNVNQRTNGVQEETGSHRESSNPSN